VKDWKTWINTVQNLDCLKGMKQMPEGVVHCVVTSPPYYGLRDYGTAKWEGWRVECDHIIGRGQYEYSEKSHKQTTNAGAMTDKFVAPTDTCPKCGARRVDPQLGLEKTPEEYVSKMVEVFREVKRIMHPTGTLWLNMGDSFASSGSSGLADGLHGESHWRGKKSVGAGSSGRRLVDPEPDTLAEKECHAGERTGFKMGKA
jgi:site-specific DNA-methyltransferase (cytosine-N4-specific)